MAEPVGGGLRPAARRSGLTSPEQVTHPDNPQATRTAVPDPGTTDKPQNRPAAGNPRPDQTRKPDFR